MYASVESPFTDCDYATVLLALPACKLLSPLLNCGLSSVRKAQHPFNNQTLSANFQCSSPLGCVTKHLHQNIITNPKINYRGRVKVGPLVKAAAWGLGAFGAAPTGCCVGPGAELATFNTTVRFVSHKKALASCL